VPAADPSGRPPAAAFPFAVGTPNFNRFNTQKGTEQRPFPTKLPISSQLQGLGENRHKNLLRLY